jgi:flagellar hook-associated protein 3 FlgL
MLTQNLELITQTQATLEEESSTGLKVNAPGDNPVAAQQILHLNSQNAAITQYASNITSGTATLTMSDSAMSSMVNTLTSLTQIATEMSTGTVSPTDMTDAVSQVQQLQSQMISLGNTQVNGNYIFGGFETSTPPFDATTGAYSGTGNNTSIQIGQNSQVMVSTSGAQVIAGGTPPGSSGTDIMSIFSNLLTALSTGSQSGVQAQLTNIANAVTQVSTAQSNVGASLNRMTAATSIGSSMTLANTTMLSSIQDADFTQVVSQLSSQQTAYQAALAADAKVSQSSLLDYLK